MAPGPGLSASVLSGVQLSKTGGQRGCPALTLCARMLDDFY